MLSFRILNLQIIGLKLLKTIHSTVGEFFTLVVFTLVPPQPSQFFHSIKHVKETESLAPPVVAKTSCMLSFYILHLWRGNSYILGARLLFVLRGWLERGLSHVQLVSRQSLQWLCFLLDERVHVKNFLSFIVLWINTPDDCWEFLWANTS